MTPHALSNFPAGSPWWVIAVVVAVLAVHIGGGLTGIVSGYGAVAVRKGGAHHRLFGTVFVVSMTVMAAFAIGLAVFNHDRPNTAGGVIALYLVATGWATNRRKEKRVAVTDYAALIGVAAIALLFLFWGEQARIHPGPHAAPFYFVFGSFAGFVALLDLRVIWQGGVSGVQRLARHLWRMCFALFFAAASFFLGQQKVMPAFLHRSPLLWVLGLAPLALLIFWMVRVQLGRRGAPAAA